MDITDAALQGGFDGIQTNPTDPFDPDDSNPSEVTTGGTPPDTATDPSAGESEPLGTSEPDAPTTTQAGIKRPTEEDVGLLAFAQSFELTIRDLYDASLAAGVFEAEAAVTITTIREAHEAYAHSISGLITREAPNKRDETLYSEFLPSFAGSATDVAAAAAGLENQGVATHLELLGSLVGVDGAALIAAVLNVEARHATVLNSLAGAADLAGLLASDAEPIPVGGVPG